jgi:prepilin-type N-terminal cleavage/methylation domain-containing protein
MNHRGYSLVEVMIAAAIIAVGLTAAAVLVGSLMTQQEINAASLRATNLQEQAVRLYRLDVPPAIITELLPEPASADLQPAAGTYGLNFTSTGTTNVTIDGTDVQVDLTTCTLAYVSPVETNTVVTNSVSIVRPSIRIDFD